MTRQRKFYRRGDAMVILVVVLAAVLLGVVGFVAWQKLSKDDETAQEATKTQEVVNAESENEQEQEKREAYKGERVESLDGVYSIKIPNGWHMVRTHSSPNDIYASMTENTDLAYVENNNPVIETVAEGSPPESPFVVESCENERSYSYGGSEVEFRLDDGTTGMKTRVVTEAHPNNIDGGESDWYYIGYHSFAKGGQEACVYWTAQIPADGTLDPKQEDFIDSVVRSIEIN